MKQALTLATFICLSLILKAQTSVELSQQEDLKTIQLEANQALNPSPNSNSTISFQNQGDNDNDGMDDAWEMQNGLDPFDPHDAWWDQDGDQVLNLFEYQLGTDIADQNSPVKVDFGPNADYNLIYNAINDAKNQAVLVRLSAGTYDNFGYVKYFSDDFECMIQGGWDATFTDYDPEANKTIIRDSTQRAIIIGSTNVQYSTVVLDGIQVINSGDFYLGGGIELRQNSKYSKTSIYNCQLVDNNYYGLSISFKDEAEDAQLFIANSLIGSNPSGGIYTQVTDNAKVQWHLYNNTIHNPGPDSEGGIDGLTLDTGELAIALNNTINWGNNDYSFNFSTNNIVNIDVKNSSVDQANPGLTSYTEYNNLNTAPLFVDVPALDFSLIPSSPCIDAGVLLGLPYKGTAPDIGVEQPSLKTGLLTLSDKNVLSVQPNILSSTNTSFYLTGLEAGTIYSLTLVDVLGRRLWTQPTVVSAAMDHHQPNLHLSSGLYFLVLKTDNQQFAPLPLQLIGTH